MTYTLQGLTETPENRSKVNLILRFLGSILTPEEQNVLLFFNRLNLILYILPNELCHALNIGTPNGIKASAGFRNDPSTHFGVKIDPRNPFT